MSWLSAALKRNHLDVLNQVAKPIQAVVNPIVNNIPVIGGVKQGLEAVGKYIPQPSGHDTNAVIKAVTDRTPQTPGAPGGNPLDSIFNFVTGNNGLNALGIAQGVNAANLSRQSTDYAKSALASATGAYDAKAPLRATGIQNMTRVLGTPSPSVSPLASIAARNPFAARSSPP